MSRRKKDNPSPPRPSERDLRGPSRQEESDERDDAEAPDGISGDWG